MDTKGYELSAINIKHLATVSPLRKITDNQYVVTPDLCELVFLEKS